MKETAVFQQLVYARWAWKELFRRTMWEIKNQVLCVSENHTIKLPENCERLINISVLDRTGHLQPLTCDPGLNTVEIVCCQPKCSCNNCHGQNTLCGAVDAVTYTTETIIIQGTSYEQQTWVRYDNGAIQQQQIIPALNAATNEVEYNTEITTICNVETTDKGCIKATDENMESLRTYCGCGNFPDNQTGVRSYWNNCRRDSLIPQPYNFFGYWNVNANDPSIIHIFRNDTTHNPQHEHHGISKVIVSYQTNGETPNEEIMIPEFAQFAVQMGMMWQQKLFNPRAAAGDKEYSMNQWRAACMKVNKHLNPIRMEDIAKLQTQMRRW